MSEFEKELAKIEVEVTTPIEEFILEKVEADESVYGKFYEEVLNLFKDWQPPKPLVVVPQIVADFIKTLKIKGIKPLMDSATFGEIGFTEEKRDEILHWINEHQEEYMRAWLDDYTVEKEKLFYLRNKITRAYLFEDAHDEYFEYFNVKRKEMDRRRKAKFTQSEIDELHAGSYEQIPVEMSDNGI